MDRSATTRRESVLERSFNLGVRRLGGITIKLVPLHAGLPDRLVLLPDGQATLVELKADGGILSPSQILWHSRSAAIGHPVTVLTGRAEIEAWLSARAVPVLG